MRKRMNALEYIKENYEAGDEIYVQLSWAKTRHAVIKITEINKRSFEARIRVNGYYTEPIIMFNSDIIAIEVDDDTVFDNFYSCMFRIVVMNLLNGVIGLGLAALVIGIINKFLLTL